MQIINPSPSSGQYFGAALGQGLAAGLEGLAQGKLDQLHRRNKEKALGSTFGPELAKTLSHLSEPEFNSVLGYLSNQGKLGIEAQKIGATQSQPGYLMGLGGDATGNAQTSAQTSTPEQISSMAKRLAPGIVASGALLNKTTAQPSAQAGAQKNETLQRLGGSPAEQMLGGGTQGMKLTPELITQQGPQNVAKVGMTAPIKKTGPLTLEDFKQIKQQQSAEQSQTPAIKQPQTPGDFRGALPNAKTIMTSHKETKKYIDEVIDRAKSSQESTLILNRMEELNNTGKVMGSTTANLLSIIGGEKVGEKAQKLFSNKETQEFVKLSKQFIRGAKAMFGARPTQFDIQALLDTVPNLSQSEEGRREIIRDCKLLNSLVDLEQKTMSDIISKNGGVAPLDIKKRTFEEMAPAVAEIDKQFAKGGASENVVGKTLQGMPDPKDKSIEEITVDGKPYVSNGKNWVPKG